MTSEMHEHLAKVRNAIQSARLVLSQLGFVDDSSNVVVIGFMAQGIEHHEAILALIGQDKVGSAFALARFVVEGMYRGLWINLCAADREVQHFIENDEVRLSVWGMAEALDDRYGANFYRDFKDKNLGHTQQPNAYGYASVGPAFHQT